MRKWNTQFTGATRVSAKTTTMVNEDIMPTIEDEDCFVALCDSHATGGTLVAGYTLELDMADRLRIIDLSRDYYMSWGWLFRSTNPSPHKRKKENRRFARMIASILSVARNESIDNTRIIKEWIFFAIALWQTQPEELPPHYLIYALLPKTTEFDSMRQATTSHRLQAKADQLKAMMNSPRFYDVIGPALRLLEEMFDEPTIYEMMHKDVDLETDIRAKKVYVILGSGEEWLDRVVMKAFVERCTQIVADNWSKTKTPLFMRTYVDEASRFVNENEANNVGKTVKMGQTFCFASQLADYGDPFVNARMEENLTEKWMGHPGSEEAAQRIAYHLKLLRDAFKIHHQTERVIVEDYQEIGTVSSTEKDGKRTGTTHGSTFRPKPTKVTDNHFWSFSDQDEQHIQEAMTMGPGQFVRRRGTQVWFESCERTPIPFCDATDWKQAIEKHILWQIDQGIMRPPKGSDLLCRTNNGQKNGQPKSAKPRKKKLNESLRLR